MKANLRSISTITVTLADDDLAFLRRFSKEQGTPAEEMLALQARSLRRQLARPLPPATIAASRTISGDVEASKAYSDHLDRKHRRFGSTGMFRFDKKMSVIWDWSMMTPSMMTPSTGSSEIR